MGNVFEVCKLLIAGQLVIDYVGCKEIPVDKLELARKRIQELEEMSIEWELEQRKKERKVGD